MLGSLGLYLLPLFAWTFAQGACVAIRLRGGPVLYAGRVEVRYEGVWGRLCEDRWDLRIGHVICRQLGYSAALSVPCCESFGRALGPLWLDGIRCVGNETSVADCAHGPWGVTSCRYYADASVVCKPANVTANITQVRLSGASVPYAGRVDVLYAGVWGDVGMFHWGIGDGHVVCRSLGFTAGALTAVYRSKEVFDSVRLVTWLDNVRCEGNESSLEECDYTVQTYKTTYGHYSAGVVCDQGNRTVLRLRLNGPVPHAGRVEANLAGVWGTVQAGDWSLENAHVVCKQLGYQGAELAVVDATLVFNRNTSRAQWIRHTLCKGNETSLFECRYKIAFRSGPNPDAGAVCRSSSREPKLRLRGSRLVFAGRLEVQYGGTWGSVHNSHWDLQAANVSCRELGYDGALMALRFGSDAFGEGSGPVWLSDVRCRGTEPSIANCSWSRLAGSYLLHDSDAAVVCKTENSTSDMTQVQVRISGPVEHAGRVEVRFLGIWGTISARNWSQADGDVVCRQQGYSRSLAALTFGAFGPGKGPVWLHYLGCHGNETSLSQCPHGDWLSSPRGIDDDASVVCGNEDPVHESFQVRLAGGPVASAGRVEVRYLGVWGSVVHVVALQNFGAVVCRQLGFIRVSRVIRDAASLYGRGTGPVWMTHVRCSGNETRVTECSYEQAYHKRIPEVAVICHPDGQTTVSPLANSTVPTSSIRLPTAAGVPSSPDHVVIGLSVSAVCLVLAAAVVLVLIYFRRCRAKRDSYDPRRELELEDDVAVVGRVPYSFDNSALEFADCDTACSTPHDDSCEAPEQQPKTLHGPDLPEDAQDRRDGS